MSPQASSKFDSPLGSLAINLDPATGLLRDQLQQAVLNTLWLEEALASLEHSAVEAIAERSREIGRLERQLGALARASADTRGRLVSELLERGERELALERRLADLSATVDDLQDSLAEYSTRLAESQRLLEQICSSRGWRALQVLRRMGL